MEHKVERQGAATTVQSCDDREDKEGEFSYDGDLWDLSNQDDALVLTPRGAWPAIELPRQNLK